MTAITHEVGNNADMLYSKNGFLANLKPSHEEIINLLDQRNVEKRSFY